MWVFVCLYNPHKRNKSVCCNAIETVMNELSKCKYKMKFLIGDLNINCLNEMDSKCLKDVSEVHGLTHIVKQPTCQKSEHGTLLDVILTTNTVRIGKAFNLINDISDFHNIVGFSSKLSLPQNNQDKIIYRYYKHFEETLFKNDVAIAPFHVAEIFDDINDQYYFTETLFKDVIELHAPLKSRKPLNFPSPFMNSELRKTIHYKAMLRNKYFRKGRHNASWEEYRKVRNKCNKLKAKSIRYYFDKKCSSDSNTNQSFWKTIKPFVSDRVNKNNECITLRENEQIISEPRRVSEIFNEYFCNVAKDIGPNDVLTSHDTIASMVDKLKKTFKHKINHGK